MAAATEKTSTSGKVILSAELLSRDKLTGWSSQPLPGCATDWGLYSFTNIGSQTSSSHLLKQRIIAHHPTHQRRE